MNRRQFYRRKHRLRVRLQQGRIATMTGDVSVGGIFIYSARVHKPGTRVRLVLELPAGPVEVDGVVKWAKRVPIPMMGLTKGGMGIQILSAPEAFLQYLQDNPHLFLKAVGS